MQKALVAMSGGVDSTVAAFLLREQGILCTGAAMRLEKRDTGAAADARAAAGALGIPFTVFDYAEAFSQAVAGRFIAAYRAGQTPNPCVDCNRLMKFGRLMDCAREMGFDYMATGHYARVERENGRFLLKKAADPSKDQTYVLYTLTQEQLAHALFPLGELTKGQVRKIAGAEGFPCAEKGDSQDICFVPDGDYAGFIERTTGRTCPVGRFVDTDGNDLGEHRGIIHYTVGQRRGLGLSHPEALYVQAICAETNTVVVGTAGTLFSQTLTARAINLIAYDRIDGPLRVTAKIRYRHPEQPATVTQLGDDALRVDFDAPQRAVTPGQAVVLYDGDRVVGGGTIAQHSPDG